ncbi:MAG: hypothetical protein HOI95_17435 [Chromatiales bacterium]|nr:hypothetical protein [Chromatiales bacterium]
MDGTSQSGVRAGKELVAFAEAAVQRDPVSIANAADALRGALSDEALVDAAGVISNFQRMVRIADATGIGLGEQMEQSTVDFRDDLGIEAFARVSEC